MQPQPPPDPYQNADQDLAKTAAVGCFAGMGVAGTIVLLVVLGIVAVVLVGAFLLFLTCSGH